MKMIVDFFLCNENEPKNNKKKKSSRVAYSHTKVKARKFVTNISCSRLNKSDHTNISFVVDCYSFIVRNSNLFR